MSSLDERSEHRRRKRQNRAARVHMREAKGNDVPIIESQIPDVAEGFHTLAIEFIELVEGTAYNQPDVPETRVKMQLRVETPDEPEERFVAYMSQNLSEKSTLGSIIKAVTGSVAVRDFDTDDLIGKKFGHMVRHNDGGWPQLVSGTAAPIRDKKNGKKNTIIKGNEPELLPSDEAPF
jgi:hypothetical protein